MPQSVLIIDDEATLVKNIQTYLIRHGYEARTALNGEQGLGDFENFKPDVILLDFQLTGMDGLEVLRRIQAKDSQVKVIIMTGHGSAQVAVDAMKAGAYDYLSKPLVLAELKLLLDKAIEQTRLEGALAYYQGKQAKRSGLAKLLGGSPPMLALKRKLRQFIEAEQRLVDGAPAAVLITGETGTGKELVARAFHFEGPRRDTPFVEINCASIPGHLMEAELLGYERGAFTDAKDRKLGLVETADGGTLFLDEIAEMDLALQAKLLKLLEDKIVRRLGSLRDHKVDVRIITATNQDLEQRLRQGTFRSDLFFRLRIIHIELPPLRQRGDDVLLLANEFLKVHGRRYGKEALRLSPAAEDSLWQHAWPGNVRELRNVIEQAVLLTESREIEPIHLALNPPITADDTSPVDSAPTGPMASEQDLNLERIERQAITQALKRTSWNVTRAARLLGLSRDTLRYRMEKYKLRNPSSFC